MEFDQVIAPLRRDAFRRGEWKGAAANLRRGLAMLASAGVVLVED